ncbi:MAG: DUF3048 domain-containing protein [Clostridiales bacterium]|nr:DUF3048 domain-containing protein [Clostridiales bacterium]
MQNNKKIIIAIAIGIVMIIVIIGIVFAIRSGNNENETSEIEKEIIEKEDNVPIIVVEPILEEDDQGEVDLTGKVINPLTGLYVDDSVLDRRPIAVMLDNLYSARPQAALSEADIVYEILAEGRITRYMAIFYSDYPELIGPVRSARPYFVEKALEYDPYYVHVGGSNQALKDIRAYEMADIDGLSSGSFWRVSHKRIPHNMYTSSKVLIEEGNRKGYTKTKVPEFLSFNDDFLALNGTKASEITFEYKEPTPTDRTGYTTSYTYNNENKLYYRYTNGEPHVDENDQNQLTCTNIIVQYAKTKVIDNEGRLKVDFIGSGTGKLYTGGEVIDIKWDKSSAHTSTSFYKSDGTPIKLNPGVTWFQIFETGKSETIIQ